MDLQSGALFALTLGFLLGLKHATDADHVVAVSTIVSEYRNAWRGIWIGASWGLGHTTPLLVVGIIILVLKEAALDRYETVAPVLEFGVAIMLVFLGVQVFWNLRRGQLHVHEHTHDEAHHLHIHATHESDSDAGVETHHGLFRPGRPFFRLKSYLIGIVHGLAGSAAVMLVLLPEIELFWVGVGYLLLFGVGTMLSMAAVTLLLGIPFAIGGKFERVNRTVAGVAGTASLVFGFALMADIVLDTSLLPF
jgi:ABC-type nickel/cobalt efflux system permease component RcnA